MILSLLLTILAYFFVVLQTSLIHFNFLLVLIFIFGSRLSFFQGIYFAFIGGLFIDAASVRILGQSSLGFILILSIMPLFTYRFSFHNPVSRYLMYFVLAMIFEIYLGHGFLIWQNLLVSLLAVFFGKSEKENIKI